MKTVLCLLGALIVTTAIGTPAHAQNYPWCALYSGRALGGATNCGFTTFQQCLATVSGIGGFCEPNTQYRPPRTAPALPRLSILGSVPLRTLAAQESSTTSPSRIVTRRSICDAMSRLCVAMIAARPEARTN